MRQVYARWLLEFTEEHGEGLGVGERAEVEEAEFRVYGLARVPDASVPSVKSNVAVGDGILAWEPEVLSIVANELIPVFDPKKDDGSNGQ